MACYKFTYKDVLKRYERIINKPSKFEIRLLASILLIITIVNITSLCFADEGDIPENYNLINQNLLIGNSSVDSNTGVITSNNNSNMFYIDISNFDSILYFNTKSFKYYLLDDIDLQVGDTMSTEAHVISTNNDGIYLDTRSIQEKYIVLVYYVDNVVTVYGRDYSGMGDATKGLVDNVGISQIWDIFDTSIGFVGVVVLVAFGIFLIVIAIRKMQKGKSEF